jgi:SAM-dependent methyltransferase
MAFLNVKDGTFTYFSIQVGEQDWSNKDVLDFGGNVGALLHDPANTVDEARYWCFEVQKEATEMGRAKYPRAHWIYYDRYNFYFNPRGIPDLPIPDTGQKFDYIVAYSVFTSAQQADLMSMVSQLSRMLKPNGLLAFTFIDPNYHSWPGVYPGNNLQWRLEKIRRVEGIDVDVMALVERAQGARWCVLINDHDLYVNTNELPFYPPEKQETCHLYYSCEYMATLIPMAEILPPVNKEMQHCCVIQQRAQ